MSCENRTEEMKEQSDRYWVHGEDVTDIMRKETDKILSDFNALTEKARVYPSIYIEQAIKIQNAVEADPEYKRLDALYEKQFANANHIAGMLLVYFSHESIDFEPLIVADDVVKTALESLMEYAERQKFYNTAKFELANEISKQFVLTV